MQFSEHEKLGYSKNWRVQVLHFVAKALGVLIHIDAMPYGGKARSPQSGTPSVRWNQSKRRWTSC